MKERSGDEHLEEREIQQRGLVVVYVIERAYGRLVKSVSNRHRAS